MRPQLSSPADYDSVTRDYFAAEYAAHPGEATARGRHALLRDCRVAASIGMRTGAMRLPDAAAMMAKQCLQPPSAAHDAVAVIRRGTTGHDGPAL